MTIDIDAIRKRLDAASVGPWETGEDGLVWPPHTGDPVSGSIWLPDAEFIAHARTDIPALLAELDVMREVVEAAKAWRAQFGEFGPLDSADTPSGDLTDAVDALNSGTGGA